LEKEGFVSRKENTCPKCKNFKIVNRLSGTQLPAEEEETHISAEREWYWEGNVQQRIVEYLKSQGVQVIRYANTETREAGVDIRAIGKTGKDLLITVKGYPTKSSNTQARHWFSQAIFDIVLYRQEYPDCHYAIGLPAGFVTYENLARRVTWLKQTVPFSFIWVKKDGTVLPER
jgi:hypothetical protein